MLTLTPANPTYGILHANLQQGNDRPGRVDPSGQVVEYTVTTHAQGSFTPNSGSGNTLWLTGYPSQNQTGAGCIAHIMLPPR